VCASARQVRKPVGMAEIRASGVKGDGAAGPSSCDVASENRHSMFQLRMPRRSERRASWRAIVADARGGDAANVGLLSAADIGSSRYISAIGENGGGTPATRRVAARSASRLVIEGKVCLGAVVTSSLHLFQSREI